MDISTFGLASVAGITVICYLVGLVVKAAPRTQDKYIPIACGLVGGALGVGAGSLAAQETGQQITLRYDDGHEELVVQGAEPPLQAGQRVRVIIGADGSRRVEPAY